MQKPDRRHLSQVMTAVAEEKPPGGRRSGRRVRKMAPERPPSPSRNPRLIRSNIPDKPGWGTPYTTPIPGPRNCKGAQLEASRRRCRRQRPGETGWRSHCGCLAEILGQKQLKLKSGMKCGLELGTGYQHRIINCEKMHHSNRWVDNGKN